MIYLHKPPPIAIRNVQVLTNVRDAPVTTVWPNAKYAMLDPRAKFGRNQRSPVIS